MDNAVDMQSLLAKADPSIPPPPPVGTPAPVPAPAPTSTPVQGQAKSVGTLLAKAPPMDRSQGQVAPPIQTKIGAAVTPPQNLSWAEKMAQSLMQPANGQPLKFGAAMTKAAIEGIAPPPQSKIEAAVGGTPWNAARSNVDQTPPTTPIQQPPGGWRGRVNQFMAGLGDASQGTKEGGWLTAVTGTLANRNQRLNQEMKDREMMAMSNAQMVHEQAMTHKLGEDAIKDSIKEGSAALDNIMNPGPGGVPGKKLAEGVTSDQLNLMIQKKTIDPSVDTAFATGRIQVGEDTNGQPIFRTTYTVVKAAGDVQINKENVGMLNKYLHRDYAENQILPAVQFNHEIQQAFNARTAAQTRDMALLKNDIEIQGMKDDVASREIGSDPKTVQAMSSAAANIPGGQFDEYTPVKAYGLLKNTGAFDNPQSSLYGKEVPFRIWAGGGDPKDGEKNFKQMEENLAKAQEKTTDASKDITQQYREKGAEMLDTPDKASSVKAAAQVRMQDKTLTQNQRDEAAAVYDQANNALKFQREEAAMTAQDKAAAELKAKTMSAGADNPNHLVGDAYIATLPADRQAMLASFNSGHLILTPQAARTPSGMQLVADLTAAYPGFDQSKAEAYVKTRIDFSSGKVSVSLNQANTALHHLNLMANALDHNPTLGKSGEAETFLNADRYARSLNNEAKALSDEMSKFYTGGVATQAEADDWKDRLNPYGLGMTSAKLKENIEDFVNLLGGKLQAYQDQWSDARPSDSIQAPKGIASQESADTYKRLTGNDLGVEVQQQQRRQAPNPNAPTRSEDLQRPARFPNAAQTAPEIVNGKPTGRMAWLDAQGKFVGYLNPDEMAVVQRGEQK